MRQSHGTAPKSTGMPEAHGRMQCNLWLKWKTFFNPPTAWFLWQTQKSRLWLPFSCPEDQPAYSAPFGSPDSLLPILHCFPVGCLSLAGFQYGPSFSPHSTQLFYCVPCLDSDYRQPSPTHSLEGRLSIL